MELSYVNFTTSYKPQLGQFHLLNLNFGVEYHLLGLIVNCSPIVINGTVNVTDYR